jgi:hypothetical protein
MKWIVAAAVALVVPGGTVILALAWWRSRQLEQDEGHYVARITDWYRKDPQIRPLTLPAVRSLQAQQVKSAPSRVRRFDERRERGAR